MTAADQAYISRNAASKILQSHPQRVNAMIERGELTAYMVAGRVRLLRSEVEEAATPKPITPN